MTRIHARFEPSYTRKGKSPGFLSFDKFMVSDQIRRPLGKAAIDIVAVAKALAPRSKDPRKGSGNPHYADAFAIHLGPMETLVFDSRVGKMNRHAMVQISNHADDAVPVEYGSGITAEGPSGGAERTAKQGGFNKAMRPLGRAGRKIGRASEEK